MKSPRRILSPLLLALSLFSAPALLADGPAPADTGPETRVVYLSGEDVNATRTWEFRCDEGRRCGSWQTIEVPSHWEQQGFGNYNYGHDEDKHDEVGEYRLRFRLPDDWQEERVDLVFAGVMTDAEVTVNGQSAGPRQQGAFYRFRYDVTDLIQAGDENLLEVKVWKVSSDRKVEAAERDADYWVFGGIFRPVWLEGRPAESLEHVAYDPRHDGQISAQVRFREPLSDAATLRLERLDGSGTVAEQAEFPVTAGSADAELEGRFDVLPWSAETPHLYPVRLSLRRGETVLHQVEHRLGFRTVEVDPERGLLINGQKVMLKGVNRHTFHPTTGRATNRILDRADAERIKAMHMNAVRMSHYPPDPSFLEACDELGLYVLDELAGWHDAYGTEIGRGLIRAMVERDVNHPSIIFWNNGNEDGWNTALDGDFAKHDPQGRRVLHPRSLFEGIDTMHYLHWQEMVDRVRPESRLNRWRGLWGPLPLLMPTEILHGLYDGGSAAGLEDYWRLVRSTPRGMGLFLWVFTDEAVERTDQDGALDTDGNHAPDGVIGPYRETSGNEHAIRKIWAPVQIETTSPVDGPTWDGRVVLDNQFDHLDLEGARLTWFLLDGPQLEVLGPPPIPEAPDIETLHEDSAETLSETGTEAAETVVFGTVDLPSVRPGERVAVDLDLPTDFRAHEAVHLRLTVPGRALGPDTVIAQRFPLHSAAATARRMAFPAEPINTGDLDDPAETEGGLRVDELPSGLCMLGGDAGLELDGDGRVAALIHGERRFDLPNPVASGQEEAPTVTAQRRLDGDGFVGLETRFGNENHSHDENNGLVYLRWQVFESGWVRLSWQTRHRKQTLPGLVLPLSVDDIEQIRWLGPGPTRIWGNRPQGVWGRHHAQADGAVLPHQAHEPQFRGYYAARELEATTAQGTLHIVSELDRIFAVGRPSFPEDSKEVLATEFSPDGLAILERAPGIGTKFHPAEDLGPQSRDPQLDGLFRGAVWLALR